MGLDFWAAKLKKGLTKEDFRRMSCWDLVEDDEIEDLLEEDVLNFVRTKWNDRTLYNFCKDTVNFFVGSEAVDEDSEKDINELTNRLNDFISQNPNYVYKNKENVVLSNSDIKLFIRYINAVRDNGFVLWCSW